jgi:hypothetical protein
MGKAQLIHVHLRYGFGGGLPALSATSGGVSPLSLAEHVSVEVLYPIDHLIVVVDSLNGHRPTHSRSFAVRVRKWTPALPATSGGLSAFPRQSIFWSKCSILSIICMW